MGNLLVIFNLLVILNIILILLIFIKVNEFSVMIIVWKVFVYIIVLSFFEKRNSRILGYV